MVDSRQKGARAESQAKDLLNAYAGGKIFERTPSSGALNEKHFLKGDLYIPAERNLYTIEVKSYKESQINHLMLGKSPKLIEWWQQTERQARQNRDNIPLLLFKHDRSKFYVATEEINMKAKYSNIIYSYSEYKLQISLLSNFLEFEKPKFKED